MLRVGKMPCTVPNTSLAPSGSWYASASASAPIVIGEYVYLHFCYDFDFIVVIIFFERQMLVVSISSCYPTLSMSSAHHLDCPLGYCTCALCIF